MKKIYYSEKVSGFIPFEWKADGTYSTKNWPADAVLLSASEMSEYWKQHPPYNKTLGAIDGRPVWVDIPPPPPLTADELAATARQYRDDFIVATDPMMVSDYCINDMPLTEAQRAELTATRTHYRAWPTAENWPLIELPELPQWLLVETVNQGYRAPAWP
ncbi:TPA: phage tail protein [Yersinia enterocolitica]